MSARRIPTTCIGCAAEDPFLHETVQAAADVARFLPPSQWASQSPAADAARRLARALRRLRAHRRNMMGKGRR